MEHSVLARCLDSCSHNVQELVECMKDPPSGTKVELLNESNIYKWIITMDGPEQSAYQVCVRVQAQHLSIDQWKGGRFVLLLSLPTDYPFKPPVLAFQTRIYHPNVSNDDKGSMCLGMLRSDEWKPPNKILAVLNMVNRLSNGLTAFMSVLDSVGMPLLPISMEVSIHKAQSPSAMKSVTTRWRMILYT